MPEYKKNLNERSKNLVSGKKICSGRLKTKKPSKPFGLKTLFLAAFTISPTRPAKADYRGYGYIGSIILKNSSFLRCDTAISFLSLIVTIPPRPRW